MNGYVRLSTLNVGDWVTYQDSFEIYEIVQRPYLKQVASNGTEIGCAFQYFGWDEIEKFRVVRTATPLKIEDFV